MTHDLLSPAGREQDALDRSYASVLGACPADFRASLDRTFTQDRETRVYRAEIVRLYQGFAPLFPFEWCIIRDCGAMAVEIARNERMIADLVDLGRLPALRPFLRSSPTLKGRSKQDLENVITDYVLGDPDAVDLVEDVLREQGHTPSILAAISRTEHAPTIEAIERSIQVTRKASSKALRDMSAARRGRGRGTAQGRDRDGAGLVSTPSDDGEAA